MKKDIEKYINDNIKAETPPSLSMKNIEEKLDGETQEINPKRKISKQSIYKAVAVAAAFALILSGVSVYGTVQKTKNAPLTNKTPNISTDESYNAIYAKLKEMKKEWVRDYAEDVFFDGNGFIGSNKVYSADSVPEAGTGSLATNEAVDNERNFGTTNTQEENIDEGDIIKTDGKNIYLADKNNKTVYIVKADSGKMNKLSEIKLSGDVFIEEMYLANDKLFVVFSEYDYSKQPEKDLVFNSADTSVAFRCCCPASWAYSETKINIYDVSNPQNVSLISSFSQSGDFVSSRLNNGKLYLVSRYYVDISSKDYKKSCIPEIGENGQNERIPASKITLVKDAASPTYAVISVFDIANAKKTDSSAIFGDPSNVYATENSFYLVEPKYDDEKYTSYLNILKFAFTETGVEYKASARADGTLNDNFSMSEYNGYFRIATTCPVTRVEAKGKNSSDATVSYLGETNKLYVFDSELNQVGILDNFAENEQIRSARYIGNYAYVVTFRQTDPLFVINLSNPQNSKIEGELKLPGFSSYLHPIGNGMLIGIGFDGNEFSANGNMKVSLFSVSDPKNPKELSSVKVGNNGDYISSDVFYSYKSFISLPNGEFAVPVSINYSRNQMYIRYKVSDGAVSEIARYKLGDDATEIIGGTYIGNYFYAFSSEFIDSEKSADVVWQARLTSFNMKTNEQADAITLS